MNYTSGKWVEEETHLAYITSLFIHPIRVSLNDLDAIHDQIVLQVMNFSKQAIPKNRQFLIQLFFEVVKDPIRTRANHDELVDLTKKVHEFANLIAEKMTFFKHSYNVDHRPESRNFNQRLRAFFLIISHYVKHLEVRTGIIATHHLEIDC